MTLLALLAHVLLFTFRAVAAMDTPVRIESGLVAGNTTGGVTAFKGIPYALAPVGELRWRAPLRPLPWAGVREAREFGPPCVQVPLAAGRAYQSVAAGDRRR
jgi:para-nitrobenzyl esterase